MRTARHWIKEWVPSVLIAVFLTLTIKTYVAEAVLVPTGSMIPTIQLNDRFLIEKMVGLTKFNFGDIVVFYPPLDDEKNNRFVKRLIGMSGDKIEIRDGNLYRNDALVDEPYVKEKMEYTFGPVIVPEGEYFFLGDNRNESLDSHLWPTPFVKKESIVGKVFMRVYPFQNFGTV